ncbi:Uncharacterised protein [Mycobacteroides abscessus subsp. abscessus]|nr:Uncharacterised protein [Mycobacteroides abscessus subsp. abscessus]SKU25419.1 Uncharacterised protein [Mycobacteroides abscessus subsp. abscessus]
MNDAQPTRSSGESHSGLSPNPESMSSESNSTSCGEPYPSAVTGQT